MSEFFTLLLREVESGWVWIYTAGMPEEARQSHVGELESDGWEHETLAAERHERFGLQFLHRVARGMPADIGWRLAQGRRGFEGRNWLEATVAMLLAVGIFVGLPASGLLMPYSGISNNGMPMDLFVGVDALLVILVLVLPGILVIKSSTSEDHTVFEWLVAVAAAVVAGAIVWMTGKAGTVPGSVGGAANRALAFGIVAAVSLPVFWLGIYPLFAAGSFVLGGSAVRDGAGATKAKAIVGMVLAGIATVFCAALNLFG